MSWPLVFFLPPLLLIPPLLLLLLLLLLSPLLLLTLLLSPLLLLTLLLLRPFIADLLGGSNSSLSLVGSVIFFSRRLRVVGLLLWRVRLVELMLRNRRGGVGVVTHVEKVPLELNEGVVGGVGGVGGVRGEREVRGVGGGKSLPELLGDGFFLFLDFPFLTNTDVVL